jgi:hypothetical protein
VIESLLKKTWKADQFIGIEAEINRSTSFVVLDHILGLATSRSSSIQVKAIAHLELKKLREYLKTNISKDNNQKAAQELALDMIENYIRNPDREYRPRRNTPPPGSPIGSCGF